MWSYFENKQLYWLLLTLSLGKTVWIWESVTFVPAKSLSLLFQSLSVWLVRGYAAAEAMRSMINRIYAQLDIKTRFIRLKLLIWSVVVIHTYTYHNIYIYIYVTIHDTYVLICMSTPQISPFDIIYTQYVCVFSSAGVATKKQRRSQAKRARKHRRRLASDGISGTSWGFNQELGNMISMIYPLVNLQCAI